MGFGRRVFRVPHRGLLLAFAAIALCCAHPVNADIIVDDFEGTDGSPPAGFGPPGLVDSAPVDGAAATLAGDTGGGASTILGGSRSGSVFLQTSTFGNSASIVVFGGAASFSEGAAVDATFELTYGPGLNTDVSGFQNFTIDVVFFNPATNETTINLEVEISDGVNSAIVPLPVSGLGQFSAALALFAGVDLTQVDEVMLRLPDLTGELAEDISFDSLAFTVIPEPTSLAIWSLMGLGGAAYGWRRRKKKARTA